MLRWPALTGLGLTGSLPYRYYYIRRRLAYKGIVSLVVCVSVCVSAALRIVSVRPAAATRRISLGGEGNALYPVLSSCICTHIVFTGLQCVYFTIV